MRLSTILPRQIGQSESDCASILNSLVMGVHLERSRARTLGWRGVRASGSGNPSWTCRVARADPVFGISFVGEKHGALDIAGYFDLFVFPGAESPLLEVFPLRALQLAMSPDYDGAVRDFSGANPRFAPFRMGALHMKFPYGGDALELSLEAAARHKVLALSGIRAPGEWLVEPGAPECDAPAFRLLLPLFALLVATAEQALAAKAALWQKTAIMPAVCYDSKGDVSVSAEETASIITMSAGLGNAAARDCALWRRMAHLPCRFERQDSSAADLPVLHVLTGFLGSGKTTFLRRWLDFLHGRERYTGVIQNEFGEVDLDSAILKDDTLVEALDEGCVCCSIADSLRPGLERIIAALPARQFILETTGVANPANILDAMTDLDDLVRPGLVITVVDALELSRVTPADGEAIAGIRLAQIKKADVLVLNKMDAVPPARLASLRASLAALNDRAEIFPAVMGNVEFARLDALLDGFEDGASLPHEAPASLACRATHQEEGYVCRCVRFAEPLPEAALRGLLAICGPGLCRAKGIVDIAGMGPCIVQYAADCLELAPAADAPGGIALIGRGLPGLAEIRRSLPDVRILDEHIHDGRLDDVAAGACVHNGHDHCH